MDLATGDFNKYLTDYTLSGAQKIRYIFELSQAVSYIHQGGFVHCDIKPQNILMFNDTVKIGDLGLVRARENKETRFQKRMICQTAIYRSPEQFDDSMSIPGYQDIFPKKQRDEWQNNDLRGEYWSLGILFLDIIYNTSNVTYLNVKNRKVESDPFLYKNFLIKIVDDYKNKIPLTETIQNFFGPLSDDIDQQLLKLVCNRLLILDQDQRNLDLFLQDSIFSSHGYSLQKIPFTFPSTISMYKPEGISIPHLKVLYKWFEELNDEFHYPMIILSNAMDYIIQYAYLITTKSKIQLFGMVALWLMDRIYSVRDNISLMIDYLEVSGIYTAQDFAEMTDLIEKTGFLDYESLYFQLPNMRLVIKGVLMMIDDLETYIKYGNPKAVAKELIRGIHADDIPKHNGYVNLNNLRQHKSYLLD